MESLGTVAAKWLAGERVRIPSKTLLLAFFCASFVALVYAWREWRDATRPLITDRPPPKVATDVGDTRFGAPLATRKKVFEEFAAAEPNSRAEGKKSFPGFDLAWSAEDHRGSFERQKAAELSMRYRLSLTQVYLILDEGIREHWPSPDDGEPLSPYTVPLHPRRNYGW
jgi:hypothetical protein